MRSFLLCFTVLIAGVLNAQVTLQTGSANYGLPLFSFSDAKSGLGTSISLGYSSGGGLIVNSVAPNTGVGWSLATGGAIVRKQIGEPDDQNSETLFPKNPLGYTNVNGYNQNVALVAEQTTEASQYVGYYYPNGFMYSEFPVDISATAPLTYAAPREVTFVPRFREAQQKSWKSSRRSLADREQDIFTYSFNGNSGQFVIGRDGSILQVNDTKLRIEKFTSDLTGQNIRTRIHEFRITDLGGIVYKFAAYEQTEVMGVGQSQWVQHPLHRKQSYEPSGKYTIQKWVLTEIYNPLTQESIVFEYQDYDIDLLTDKMVSVEETEGDWDWVANTVIQRSHQKAKRLSRILLPDGQKVEFTYSSTLERVDVPGDFPLTHIKAFYGSETTPYMSYELVYGYFFKSEIKDYSFVFTGADRRFTRLCLKSIQKKGRDISEPSYKFSYYTGAGSGDFREIVPPRMCLATDMWGYYNKEDWGDINDTTEDAVNIYAHMTQLGPYRSVSPGTASLGLLKTVENPFGGTFTWEYEQNEARLIDNPTSVLPAGGVRVAKTIAKDENNNEIATTYTYKLSDGTSSGWGHEGIANMERRQIRIWNASGPDGYTHEGRMYKDVASAGSPFIFNEMARAKFGEFLNAIAPMLRNTDYYKPALTFIVAGLVERIFALFNPTTYKWLRSYSWYPKTAHNPVGIHYSRVEVKNTSMPGGVGKTVNEFTKPANIATEIGVLQFPYSSKQRFAYWKYDLPLKTQTYNQAGTLLTETINEYDIFETASTSDNHKSNKVEVNIFNSAACDAPTYGIDVSDIASEIYYVKTGHAELKKTTVKNFGSVVMSETETVPTYNSDYLNFTGTAMRSNGDKLIGKTYYTNDYDNISTAITNMKTNNMLSVAIASETWLKKANGSEFLVGGTINEYEVLGNGQIKLKRVYALETREPIPQATIGAHRRDLLIVHPNYYKEKLINEYDADGNLIEIKTPEGKVSSRLYDYNKRFVVAEVSNAPFNRVAYSSFESAVKGGWTYNENYIVASGGVTGNRYFRFSEGPLVISRTIADNKTYIVSFWSKDGKPFVFKDDYPGGNLNPTKSYLNTYTGWTYYEFQVTGPGTLYLNNRPSRMMPTICSIDELRFYPSDAEMVTTAYDPAFGPTSVCDVNNRIAYYEYDGLGRKKLVRDEKHNVVETYEYHYKQQ